VDLLPFASLLEIQNIFNTHVGPVRRGVLRLSFLCCRRILRLSELFPRFVLLKVVGIFVLGYTSFGGELFVLSKGFDGLGLDVSSDIFLYGILRLSVLVLGCCGYTGDSGRFSRECGSYPVAALGRSFSLPFLLAFLGTLAHIEKVSAGQKSKWTNNGGSLYIYQPFFAIAIEG
jgi:hypothetical protein